MSRMIDPFVIKKRSKFSATRLIFTLKARLEEKVAAKRFEHFRLALQKPEMPEQDVPW
jgi:hypothetical protein